MPYDDATGMWKPETGSSTADQVTGLLSKGNPYIEQAKSAGMDFANSRGLGNSSIAGGATQKAAYDAALPIATNDANINMQKDLSKQGFVQQSALQGGQIASAEKIAQLGANTQTAIAGMNIAAADQQQAKQIIADAAKQAAQIKSDHDLANLQAQTQTNINSMNIDASAKQQLAQIASSELIAARQNATQTSIAQMNISDADKQQGLSIASQEKIAGNQQGTQLQIANMNVSSNQQDKAAAMSTAYANVYAGMVNAINGNTAIPADARATYLANAKTLFDNGMSLVEQTYNVQLDWGQGSASATGSPAPVAGENSSAGQPYDPSLGYAVNGDGIPVDENGRWL